MIKKSGIKMTDINISHPSLKGEVCVAHGINAFLCHQIANETIEMVRKSMNEQYIKVDDVQEHTTDNAVLKAVIEEVSGQEYGGLEPIGERILEKLGLDQ